MAYFFLGDSLLLPLSENFSLPGEAYNMAESSLREKIISGFPVELAKELNEPDIFKIPALDDPESVINVAAVSGGTTPPDNWKAIPVRQILAMFSADDTDVLPDSGSTRDAIHSTHDAIRSPGAAIHTCRAAIHSNREVSSILRACHIAQWRQASKFCGTCGAKNDDAPAPQSIPPAPQSVHPAQAPSAQRVCPRCGRIEFPRICPAVIVIITDEDRILLAHNARFKKGVYSHISGFNEAGETLEETAVREVREEVNLEIKDIEYIQSQPWPFPDSLMLGFKARYSSGAIKCDGIEIEDAKWFTRDQLPEMGGRGALSRILTDRWLAGTL